MTQLPDVVVVGFRAKLVQGSYMENSFHVTEVSLDRKYIEGTKAKPRTNSQNPLILVRFT